MPLVAITTCLARQAQVAVERRSGPRFLRWYTCGLCEQYYHGVVKCALGWACWKTYVGRPEEDVARRMAMSTLGNGLHEAGHLEDALSVRETELSMMRRVGDANGALIAQGNLALTYARCGRRPEALRLRQEVYSGRVKLDGEEHESTLRAANNYASSLLDLRRFKEAKTLLHKTMPVARRVLGESHHVTLTTRKVYAGVLYLDPSATLDDLREAVTTLEETERTARRVLGGVHPVTVQIEKELRNARAALRAREDAEPDVSAQELAAVSNRGDQAGAAADPNAELKAEIAALEAQLTEKRHELSRRTGTPEDQASPPPTGSFSIGTSSPPARGRAGRRIVRARRPPRAS